MRDAETDDGRAAEETETTAHQLAEHVERLQREAEGLARRIEQELVAAATHQRRPRRGATTGTNAPAGGT